MSHQIDVLMLWQRKWKQHDRCHGQKSDVCKVYSFFWGRFEYEEEFLFQDDFGSHLWFFLTCPQYD